MVGGHSSFSNSKIQSLLNRGTLNLLIRKHGNQTEPKCTAKTPLLLPQANPKVKFAEDNSDFCFRD